MKLIMLCKDIWIQSLNITLELDGEKSRILCSYIFTRNFKFYHHIKKTQTGNHRWYIMGVVCAKKMMQNSKQ